MFLPISQLKTQSIYGLFGGTQQMAGNFKIQKMSY